MAEARNCELKKVLIIEPFYTGSHKQLIDLLVSELDASVSLHTLPGKKWPWRARTSALWFSTSIPNASVDTFTTLFCSSVLNLAELMVVRPDLARIPNKVVYFHENQLVYPVRKEQNQERDFQFGYNQIITCLAADKVVFNSRFNMESFLSSIDSFLHLIPDHRPKNLKEKIAPKCDFLYFPINFQNKQLQPSMTERGNEPIHILWPHRWEHDKNPTLFFDTLFKLKEEGHAFRLSVLGEQFSQIPNIFTEAKEKLAQEISEWGYVESKDMYYKVLRDADVVVSTAVHEFFGVAMLEAVHHGCFPLAPKSLVYPEFYPERHLYSTPNQLLKQLRNFCKRPNAVRQTTIEIDTMAYSWSNLRTEYQTLLS